MSHEGISISQSEITSGLAKGGVSIGGGLRIKSIKNYDAPSAGSTYLNGIEYEYQGGKLLKPTARLEKHFIDFSYISDYGHGSNKYSNFTFAYANSEPSYYYICSVGVPATVGYSSVIRKEVDENGQVIRKTVLDFHNYGYDFDEQLNQLFNNAFYYCLNSHLNGKLTQETVSSGNGAIQYCANYTYGNTREGSVLYPKCVPTFFSGLFLCNVKFNVGFLRKFIDWCYLTRKIETTYDSNGNNPSSKTTVFSYNESNYQPSVKTVSNDSHSETTRYWYPSDAGNESSGLSYLTNKNHLNEVTGIDIYRNNVYTRGSRNNYSLVNNLPVVNSYRLKLQDGSMVEQIHVTLFDGAGNIREYQKMNGTPVTIVWSYNHQYPVLEVIGYTYSQVLSAASSVSQLETMSSIPYSTLKSIHSSLMQGLPGAFVTAYLYSPWHSVSRIILPNGNESVYDYDSYGRLIRTSDLFGTLQRYYYNFKVN